MSEIGFFDVVGLFGVLCLLAGYLLLQANRIDASSWAYSLINLLGSASILLSLYVDWNLAAASIEIAWCAISLGGLAKSVRKPVSPQPQAA